MTNKRGLILVNGVKDSGKSTTLASMIDWINLRRSEHIYCIENPIEFIHSSKTSIVSQIEALTESNFVHSLARSIHQDPDIIKISDLQNLESVRFALEAAESGRLVFASMSTKSTTQALDRILRIFPSSEHSFRSAQIANNLIAIITQSLLLRKSSANEQPPWQRKRVLAYDLLINDISIAEMIRGEKINYIYSIQQTKCNQGMQTMEQVLATLVKNGTISYKEAILEVNKNEEFQRLIGPHKDDWNDPPSMCAPIRD